MPDLDRMSYIIERINFLKSNSIQDRSTTPVVASQATNGASHRLVKSPALGYSAYITNTDRTVNRTKSLHQIKEVVKHQVKSKESLKEDVSALSQKEPDKSNAATKEDPNK
jgi:L-serine deaminase